MYLEGFSYRYTGMGTQILMLKKENVPFFTLISSVTDCFFNLTQNKVYYQVRKDILAILSHARIQKMCSIQWFHQKDDHQHLIWNKFQSFLAYPKKPWICHWSHPDLMLKSYYWKYLFFNQETQTKNFLCQVWTTLVCFGPLDSQAWTFFWMNEKYSVVKKTYLDKKWKKLLRTIFDPILTF